MELWNRSAYMQGGSSSSTNNSAHLGRCILSVVCSYHTLNSHSLRGTEKGISESIALKEFLPIVLACAVWGTDGRMVLFDNMGVVKLVSTGYISSIGCNR